MKKKALVLAISLSFSHSALAETNLKTVQVTTNKASQSIENITSNVTIITAQDIEKIQATTISEVLSEVNGLQIIDKGGLGSQSALYLRGFSSQRTLILIDGVRYSDPTTPNGEPPIEHLMVNDIERIEVIKGQQSGIWGANASAGVINIITQTAKNGTHGNLKVETGSFNSQLIQTSLKHANEYFDASLSVFRATSDAITAKAPQGEKISQFEDDGYENTTINAQLGFDLTDKDRLQLSHSKINATKHYDGCTKTWPETCSPAEEANEPSLYLDNRFQLSRLSFQHTDQLYDWQLNYQQSRIDRKDPNGYQKEFRGEISEAESIFNYRPESNHLLSLGLSNSQYQTQYPNDESYHGSGGFISHSHKLGKTTLNETIRRDRYSDFAGKTTYKFGLKHPLSKSLSLIANYGTSYNIPTIYNLYDGFSGNPDLGPETTTGWDLGIQHKLASITVFHNKIEEKIDYNSETYRYDNLAGITTIKGAELDYQQDWQVFDLSLNYTYLKTETASGDPLPYRAKQTLGWKLGWLLSPKVNLNLNGQYFGDRAKSQYDLAEGTQNFSIWNFRANYQAHKQAQIYAKINNLTDKNYQLINGYAAPLRNVYLGMNLQF